LNGYSWRNELQRAVNANKSARTSLRRIVDDQPMSMQQLMLLTAKAANSLGENLDALMELGKIGEQHENVERR
jgi:hypothetical protein